MGIAIYDSDNTQRIGTHADNIPHWLLSYAPGIDKDPTRFAVDRTTGKIYAFVDKKGEWYGNELGSAPERGLEHKYIIEHGQDVTDKVRELVEVSNFHARLANQPKAKANKGD